MKETTTPKDIIGLALHQYAFIDHPDQNCRFAYDEEILHTTIYRLKHKYGKILMPLQELHFVDEGSYIYSYDLRKLLDALIQSGLIETTHTSAGKAWFAPTHTLDVLKFIDAMKQEIFGDDQKTLNKFLRFTNALGDALVLSN